MRRRSRSLKRVGGGINKVNDVHSLVFELSLHGLKRRVKETASSAARVIEGAAASLLAERS
jgi:hypothetical protein